MKRWLENIPEDWLKEEGEQALEKGEQSELHQSLGDSGEQNQGREQDLSESTEVPGVLIKQELDPLRLMQDPGEPDKPDLEQGNSRVSFFDGFSLGSLYFFSRAAPTPRGQKKTGSGSWLIG